jgi:hypothetical protein
MEHIPPAMLMIELPPDPALAGISSTAGRYARIEEPAPWRDTEIRRLQALLGSPGRTAHGGDVELLVDQLEAGRVGAEATRRILTAIADNAELAAAVVGLEAAGALSGLVERWHQQTGLDRLAQAVDDPASTAAELRVVVREECWVFGARFATPYVRDRLPVLDRIGVPLIRLDGAIHAVEVGPANLPDLVTVDRDHGGYVVGPAVHAAVDRLIGQLRLLDEHAESIRRELLVQSRRAFGTVVIGHPQFLGTPEGVPDQAVREVLRTYNSHLAGIEVVTYQDLLEGARRALLISE